MIKPLTCLYSAVKPQTGVAQNSFYHCSPEGLSIRQRRQDLIWTSVSNSTRNCWKRHWSCYLRYCANYKLSAIPCSVSQAADYLAFLSMYMKHSSILIYYQAVLFYHKFFGLSAPSLSLPYLKTILSGIQNIPGSRIVPKDPFTPELLLDLAKVVDFNLDAHVLCWTGILIMFRSLLRVSHVTDSPHTLTRADIQVDKWGVTFSIHSTKTRKIGEGWSSSPW